MPGFNDIFKTHPHLESEWSLRNTIDPLTITYGSAVKVWWVCGTCSGEWESAPNSRTSAGGGSGCPVCAGQAVLPGYNDLATTHPELTAEWSPKNGELTPEMVSEGSGKKAWWVCGEGHEWSAVVNSRALSGSGCPKCCLRQTSKSEAELYRHFSERFSDSEQGVRLGRWSVDVLLRDERVAVEYDGSYFHRDSMERDVRKTTYLLEHGYRVVRVRERERRHILPPLDIEDPRYLELTYDYSPTWKGLSDVVDQITSWITNLTPTT